MADLIKTDEVLAAHHLMEHFSDSEGEYCGPDLDDCDGAVPLCGVGVWCLEYDGPDAGLWRLWRLPE